MCFEICINILCNECKYYHLILISYASTSIIHNQMSPFITTWIFTNHNATVPGSSATGASFEGGWGAVAPFPGKRKKKKRKKKRKKEKREKKKKKKKERKKGTMNNVKLLHIKCCFFQFFNSQVALKNLKKLPPPRKSWNDAPRVP